MARQRNHSAFIRGPEEPIVVLRGAQRRDSILTTMQRDRRHGYRRLGDQSALGVFHRGVSRSQRVTMSVGMDHHRNKVRVVERGRGAFIGCFIETPVRRPESPKELAKLVAILLQTGPAALTMEVVLVPHGETLFPALGA